VTDADTDLVYDGRARKRPPGAGTDVQEIYMLLAARPEGMTLDEIHAAMRDGWMYTDAYRAYEKYIVHDRAYSAHHRGYRGPNKRQRLEYGSPEFKRRAQRWWIRRKLDKMAARSQTAIRDGDRFFAGKPPKVAEVTDRLHLVELDAAAKRAHDTADVQQHVRREEAKAALMALLADRRIKGKTRDGIQLAYDVLCGR
jgi:hypothetical protein